MAYEWLVDTLEAVFDSAGLNDPLLYGTQLNSTDGVPVWSFGGATKNST